MYDYKLNLKIRTLWACPWEQSVDFDRRDFDLFYEFMMDVSEQTQILAQKPTMNGYALVVAHGFDTRKILRKYPMVTQKRDAMLLSYWKKINK